MSPRSTRLVIDLKVNPSILAKLPAKETGLKLELDFNA